MVIPTAGEAQEQARARAIEKQDNLCELSRALALLASASVRTNFRIYTSFLRRHCLNPFTYECRREFIGLQFDLTFICW